MLQLPSAHNLSVERTQRDLTIILSLTRGQDWNQTPNVISQSSYLALSRIYPQSFHQNSSDIFGCDFKGLWFLIWPGWTWLLGNLSVLPVSVYLYCTQDVMWIHCNHWNADTKVFSFFFLNGSSTRGKQSIKIYNWADYLAFKLSLLTNDK